MPTPEEYRQYAEECLQALKFASTPEVRTALLTMAQRWMDLADRQERAQAGLAPPPKDDAQN